MALTEDVVYDGLRADAAENTEAMNYLPLNQVIADYIITMDGDDYTSNVSDVAIQNIAMRGIRELGFDVTARVKSLKRSVESNNTVILPEDYVDIVKLGIVDGDGVIRVFKQNKNINYSRKIKTDNTSSEASSSPHPLTANQILDREDDKNATSSSTPDSGDLDFYVFENYLYQGGLGRLYGLGGGHSPGEYRINLDQNRIEIATDSQTTDVVIEYIADQARSTNPVVHVYAEEALRCYIYYKLCERKSTVPQGEKMRARAEYYNERRKAKARLSGFTKEEALHTIRKNFKQAPKY
tara:strand:- start:1733 stop:2620 length:888 start_codon:yes stop_codon:yes gene_type:complete